MTNTISRQELAAGLDAGTITAVETLRAEHFAMGHLPGALHLHYDEIDARVATVLPDKDAAIVTYCSNTACRNSEQVANRLLALGYTNVRKYAEGKDDWVAGGLQLVTTSSDLVPAAG